MSLIYSNIKKTIDTNNPMFLPGMTCAMYRDQFFSFESVDVSRLTDLSYFFYGCEQLAQTPIIDVEGKTGLDTMLQGCENLTLLNTRKRLNQNITFYTLPGQRQLQVIFGQNLLNITLNLDDPDTVKVLSLPTEMYEAVKNITYWKGSNGIYYTSQVSEEAFIFEQGLNACGWTFTQF